MTTEHLSCAPGSGINEDLIRVLEGDGLADILVLDGATSVADANYVDEVQGDVAWFTHAFADALARAIGSGSSQAQAVRCAIGSVRQAYRLAAGERQVPLYAHPLAALTWIRIRQLDDHLALSLYCLGDCKAFIVQPDGAAADLDPYVNPYEDVLQEAMAALTLESVTDPILRRQRLLPMLRARRESQHMAPAPNVLCLAPQGEFDAREYALEVPLRAAVLAMTDGFYRLVDPYGRYTLEDLGRRCRQDGLAPLMRELRQFELVRTAGDRMAESKAVKSADDASAVIWTALAPDSSLRDRT
ncbi:hypothetical protein [Massilia niabensis]|uniref:Protein phosphatase 2C domain-containing protein n=1 Tax=Massilia niabensis TaxID=544910 RepID=A0ABW0KYT0_9BURK